jgi:IS5 family transposase
MGSDDAKAVYKQRAATAELVNAQARNRGLLRLLVRGVEKVKAVLLWHALAHNMARLWSLAPA